MRGAVLVATTLVLSACARESLQGTPATESLSPASMLSASSTSAAPATTATSASGDPVEGTSFDACTAITDGDVATWKVDPANKRDAHQTAFGQHVRGCIWGGPDWYVKVYAVDTDLSQLEQSIARFDRQERIQIGSRSGWLVHDKNGIGCSVAIPSQQAVASVQVDLKTDLTKQHYDQCPLAVQIMTQIEPKIP